MIVGTTVKRDLESLLEHATKVVRVSEGEVLLGIFGTFMTNPTVTAFAVTTWRVVTLTPPFEAIDETQAFEIPLKVVKGAELVAGRRFRSSKLEITTIADHTVTLPVKSEVDGNEVARLIGRVIDDAENDPQFIPMVRSKTPLSTLVAAVTIGNATERSLEEIYRECRPGEVPEFVIGEGSAGTLVAFKDRCLIIKKGPLAGWMAGSMGGGRSTTFLYSHITGVEYNGGMFAGVLEILTPSYQGTANKDYWRGTTKGRNADSNDPWTLSNCLPMPRATYELVRGRLDDLRSMVADAAKPQITVQADVSRGSLGEELGKLADLHRSGVLDDDEFKLAKARAIAKFD